MTRVLVLGYGNTLRGDDGAGALAARALETRWPATDVWVEAAHQLLIEHAALLAEADHVVFIDAALGARPGSVRARAIERVDPRRASLTHHVSPEFLLAAARRFYGRCPTAELVTVAAESFAHGEALSPAVSRAQPRLVEAAADRVEARLLEPAHA